MENIKYMTFFLIYFLVHANGSIRHNLKYFETLHASSLSHHVVKRGAKQSNHPYNTIKELQFRVLGRDFRLILHPHGEVLHSNFKAYTVDGNGRETTVHVDRDNYYSGRVFGETSSDVKMHLEDGVMTGVIHTADDSYHVEPSWRHMPDVDNKTMIVYRASDVRFSWLAEDGSVPRVCGYVKEGAELDQDDDDQRYVEELQTQMEKEKYMDKYHKDKHEDHEDLEKNSKGDADAGSDTPKERVKRQSDYEYTPTKTRCPLLLVADYRFFQEMGASNTKTTISYLISLIDRVHKIYNDTVWQDRQDMDGFKGMGFVIKKILVHSEPTRVRGGEAHYNMIREKWDVRNLLEVFSRTEDNKNFCLAHLLTHQGFSSAGRYSVLGLAYIASPRLGSVGGVCTAHAILMKY